MPTNNDDAISVTAGQEVWGLGGADTFTWAGGDATIHGGDVESQHQLEHKTTPFLLKAGWREGVGITFAPPLVGAPVSGR